MDKVAGIIVARRHLAAIAMVVALLFPVASPDAVADPSSDEISNAVDGVFASGDYQRTIPLWGTREGSGDEGEGKDRATNPLDNPDWWRNEGDRQADEIYRPGARPRESSDLDIPEPIAQVFEVLMYLIIGVGVALLAYFLINEGRLFSRWKKQEWADEGASGDRGGLGGPGGGAAVADYEALAARGAYAEAVHALLLHSILAIRDRGVALSSSLTSREILRRAPLGEEEKEAFRKLVTVTEFTHFGGRQATEADFLKCRDLFRRIVGGAA